MPNENNDDMCGWHMAWLVSWREKKRPLFQWATCLYVNYSRVFYSEFLKLFIIMSYYLSIPAVLLTTLDTMFCCIFFTPSFVGISRLSIYPLE